MAGNQSKPSWTPRLMLVTLCLLGRLHGHTRKAQIKPELRGLPRSREVSAWLNRQGNEEDHRGLSTSLLGSI